MNVREVGRLRFEVSSRSRPELHHDVDLEVQPDGKRYHCTCPRFTMNRHHLGRICAHIEAAVEFVLEKYYPDTVAAEEPEPESVAPLPPMRHRSRSQSRR